MVDAHLLALTMVMFWVTMAIYVIKMLKALDSDFTLYLYTKLGWSIGSLRGQVVWISGVATHGIGEALAYELANAGVKLVLSGHLPCIYDVQQRCVELGRRAGLTEDDVLVLEPCDIRNYELHQGMVNQVMEHYGRIDVFVNNIGRTQRSSFVDISSEQDKEIFDINVFGQIALSRQVCKVFLKQRKGHFCVTSSVAGKFGAPNSATYTASKYALIGFFETIRSEYRPKGIRVTTICPGPVHTPLLERSFYSKAFEDEVKNNSKAKEGRMEVRRCGYLMAVAIANQLSEAWICLKPILYIVYLSQFMPNFGRYVLSLIPPERQMLIREGKKIK